MKSFEEQQEARIRILKAELHHRKLVKDYEEENYASDITDENETRSNYARRDYLIATIQLAEAERALVSYQKYEMWKTAEFKKEYTG
jgi:hypothetical protein